MMETDVPHSPGFFRSDEDEAIPACRFAHRAMGTIFEVVCVHRHRDYAEQAARAAFELIDSLETELTCHRGGSDIVRINSLRTGETTPVGFWTMECLLLARHFYEETGGAFDVSLGTGLSAVEMSPAGSCVKIHADKVRLDLGGIGKGYAIDRAGELLMEWEINRAIIHGGFSSVLALDAPPHRQGWPLTLSIPSTGSVLARIEACRQAWSASGIRKRDHILDPRTGLPVRTRPAVWVTGSLGSLAATYRGKGTAVPAGVFETGDSPSAVAEALSTAFMIMPLEEIADYCLKYPGVTARLLISDPANPSIAPIQVNFTR